MPFPSKQSPLCPVSFPNSRQPIFRKLQFCSFYFAFPNSRQNLAQWNLKGKGGPTSPGSCLPWVSAKHFQNPIPCTTPSSKKVCHMLQAVTLLRAYPSGKSKFQSFRRATSTWSLQFPAAVPLSLCEDAECNADSPYASCSLKFNSPGKFLYHVR